MHAGGDGSNDVGREQTWIRGFGGIGTLYGSLPSKQKPYQGCGRKTRFEALYGKKPNVTHLRAFGCASYPLIMKDERKKLDPVANSLHYDPGKSIYVQYILMSTRGLHGPMGI